MRIYRIVLSFLTVVGLSVLLLTLLGSGWGSLVSPTTLHAQDVLPADAAAVDDLAEAGYNVELVGHIGGLGLVRAVAVQGDYAYLSAGTSLVVLDVSLPTTPTVLTSLLLPSTTTDITIENGYAYVGTLSSGLRVVDVRNPAQPVAVGAFEIDKSIWDVAVAGRYAYVEGDFDGLLLVDVSNPAQPVQRGFYNPHEKLKLLAVSDGYVYLSPLYSQWLRIVDFSNPAEQPVLVGAYYTPYPGHSSDVEVVGGFAYVAAWSSGLRVVDVSNPAQPVEVAAFDTPRVEGYSVLYVSDVAVAGGFAYAGGDDDGLQVVDVSNPTQPVEVGVYESPDRISNFVVSGDTLYVAGEDGLVILRYVPTSYPVAGRVTNWDGASLPSVALSVSPTQTAVTDGSGKYTLSQLVTGTYTITPTRAGFVFEPPTRTFSVPPLARGQDFAVSSAPIYAFGGGIYDTSFDRPTPFFDPISLTLSNGTQTTSQAGFYSFADLPPGSYVVTPTLADHSFYPASRVLTIPPNSGDQDFIVVKDPTLNILGTVRQSNGAPFAGVQVQISQIPTTTRRLLRGAALLSTQLGISSTPSTTTDSEGRYAFLNLEPGLYAVTASLAGYVLLPVSHTADLPTLNEYPFTILPQSVTATISAGLTTTVTLTDTQGLTTALTFPPDALAAGMQVTVTPLLMPAFSGRVSVHHAFDVAVSSAAGRVPLADFSQPVSVTVRYSITDTRTVSDTAGIGLWWLDEGAWVEADQSCASPSGQSHDETARVVHAAICRPGLYALTGPTHQRLMPWVNR